MDCLLDTAVFPTFCRGVETSAFSEDLFAKKEKAIDSPFLSKKD